MKERSLNRSKRGKIGQNLWSRQILGRPIDLASRPFQVKTQRCGAAALAFRKLKLVSFLSSAELGKFSRFDFRLHWLYKDNPELTLGRMKNLELRRESRRRGKLVANSRFLHFCCKFMHCLLVLFLSTFYLINLLFIMYSFIVMLG